MAQDITRTYRRLHQGEDLVYFRVHREQSDLHIGALRSLPTQALTALDAARGQVEGAIAAQPVFATALVPLPIRPGAFPLEREMAEAAIQAGVGPMAAVAGGIAQAVGRALLPFSPEVIVENGGDLYIHTQCQRRIAIYAGDSPLSYRLALCVESGEWGVCTSAGVVGPSLSWGRAHAALILSHSAALADAAATAMGNRIRRPEDLAEAVNWAMTLPDVSGALAILGENIAAAGAIRLAPQASA